MPVLDGTAPSQRLSPKLLLVSHEDNVADVVDALAQHDFAAPLVGAGGDDTLDTFEAVNPDVVLMVAGLAEGDVPSLATAMRSGHYGRPAPIVLILGESESIASREAAANPAFERVVRKPYRSEELADAIRHCTEVATGARMSAAMDLAIESFVLDAMDSLGTGEISTDALTAVADPPTPNIDAAVERAGTEFEATALASIGTASGAGTQEAETQPRTPEVQPGSWTQPTALLKPERESTAVLDAQPQGETEAPTEEFARKRADEDEPLGEASVVNDPALDLLGTANMPAEDEGKAADIPTPPGGGDFARQLRMKMSAMAERLFPGQGDEERTATIAPVVASHTEIDLGEIPEDDEPIPDDIASDSGVGQGESGVTLARDAGTGLTRPRATGSAPGSTQSGQIDDQKNDISSVLARFCSDGFSGSLVLQSDSSTKRLQFEAGRIVFASSNQEADRMGELLLRQGKITSAQLQVCRALVEESGRRLGEVLVDEGHLKPRELLPAVRQHLEDIVYSVFSWTTGSYESVPGYKLDERIRLSKHPAALVVEGIRRKYDRQRLNRCLGGMSLVLVCRPGDELSARAVAAELTELETEASRYFDGEHTLRDIARALELEGLRVAQLAHAWLAMGIAELVDPDSRKRAERTSSTGYLVGETDLAIDRQRVRAKHLLVQDADYFQLLGVRQDASRFEIRRAYEAALRTFGIESFPASLQDELRDQLEEIEAVIEEAYLVLSDDQIRSKYRANLR